MDRSRSAELHGAIDVHVHFVGNGSGATGCWIRLRRWQRIFSWFMLRQAGLPAHALSGNLEELYSRRLIELVTGSSLKAVVVLAHDRAYERSGKLLTEPGTFYVPNDQVLSLSRACPRLLPGVSIHPGRPDALAELDRCIASGAVLLKCLPNCQNIDCSDPSYARFWERMAEAGLPLLVHTGGEHTLAVVRPELADPRFLEAPLRRGVRVIAAHCATKSGLIDKEYFGRFVEMLRAYPNLYGDTSAFTVPIRGRHVPECLQEPVVSRLVHGSDFPVPTQPYWPWVKGQLRWGDVRRCGSISNSLEKDFQTKLAMGFPADVFTRAWGLLRSAEGKKASGVRAAHGSG